MTTLRATPSWCQARRPWTLFPSVPEPIGEYIARRVLGVEDDPELAEQFRLKEEEFEDDDERRNR